MIVKSKSVVAIFSWVWRGRLFSDDGDRVMAVTGWRSCLLDSKWGQRRRVTFCGWFGD